MNLRVWPYFFRQALSNIANNRGVHALGLGTMVVSLLILGTFLLLFFNVNSWVKGWTHSLSMSVYLEKDVGQAQKDKIAGHIRGFQGVKMERFVSAKAAFREMKAALGNQSGLLKGLPEDMLPASFELTLNTGEGGAESSEVKKELEQLEGVDEVIYSEDWANRFDGLMHMIKILGLIIGGLLCMAVLFIISNTIKLTIYSRREEIEILKLVGATDWFVKIPFMMEGLFQGILSGGLALLVLFGGYALISAKKVHFLNLALLNFVFLPGEYLLSIFMLSVLMGLAGSLIAVGRFFDL